MSGAHVVVAGGGLAGLTAAATLARAGARVTVAEAGAVPGGRLATHGEEAFEHGGRAFRFPVEHGVHGFWRQYRNLRRLVASVGGAALLVPADTQELIVAGDGGVRAAEIGARVRNTRLPDALAQLALYRERAFLEASLGRDLPRHGRAGADLLHAMAFDGCGRDVALYDHLTVDDLIHPWPPLLRRMFSALTHSGFFGDPHEVSLAAFFLGLSYYAVSDKRDSAFDLLATDSHTALLGPLVEVVRRAGGEVLLATRVESLRFDGGRASGVVVRGPGGEARAIDADAVVLALDPPGLRSLAATGPLRDALGGCAFPDGYPSLSVRLWYTREPPRGRAATGVFGGLEADNFFWLHRLQRPFRAWHDATGGGVVECHLYGGHARRAGGADDATVAARVAAAVERAWPSLAGSRAHAHVRRNAATHVAFEPGALSRLPPGVTRAGNLFLAGDWVACPWPVLYMERACVTGLLAAKGVALAAGLDPARVPEALPPFPAAPSVARLRPVLRALRRLDLLPSLARRAA